LCASTSSALCVWRFFKNLGTHPADSSRNDDGSGPALVFIHGLGGSATSTWAKMMSICTADDALKLHRLACYSYPTGLMRLPFGARMAKIQDLARGLETELETFHRRRPEVTIVAHSLGGIVARQHVLNALKAGRTPIATKLLLYAVPNTGSSLAELGRSLSWRHRHLSQLCKDSDVLDLLNEDWVRYKVENQISVKYVVGGADKVVAIESARPFVGQDNIATLIGHDHRSIVSPEDQDDIRYRVLRDFVTTDTVREPEIESIKSHNSSIISPPDPLFDLYRPEDEPFYIRRSDDFFLRKAMSSGHVWLTGPSGVGKTTALRYCAFSSNWTLKQVMLGGYQGLDAPGLVRALCAELADLQQTNEVPPAANASGEVIAFARRQLRTFPAGSVTALVVEEIPLPACDFPVFLDLVLRLAQAIESDSTIAGRVQLAFSSIVNPATDGGFVHPKIREKIQFIPMEFWAEDEIGDLVKRLDGVIKPGLSSADKLQIVAAAEGSPRFVKMLFRRWRNGPPQVLSLNTMLASVKSEQV
jgi:hypothetical protein